jgi:hypothetical protein
LPLPSLLPPAPGGSERAESGARRTRVARNGLPTPKKKLDAVSQANKAEHESRGQAPGHAD